MREACSRVLAMTLMARRGESASVDGQASTPIVDALVVSPVRASVTPPLPSPLTANPPCSQLDVPLAQQVRAACGIGVAYDRHVCRALSRRLESSWQRVRSHNRTPSTPHARRYELGTPEGSWAGILLARYTAWAQEKPCVAR